MGYTTGTCAAAAAKAALLSLMGKEIPKGEVEIPFPDGGRVSLPIVYARRRGNGAEAAVVKIRQDAETAAREIHGQEPQIQADLARVEAELRGCEAALPAEFREAYHRVVRAKGEDALAPVRGEFCGGCHQHVPLNVCAEIMLGHPMFCKSCGRLLYIAEGGTAAEPSVEE